VLPLNKSTGPGIDKVRLTDRFFLGEPQMRGFDIRGVGPRVLRQSYDFTTGKLVTDKNNIVDDAVGGRAYYQGRAELEIPLGSGAKELGLRPSIFLDVGAVFGVTKPNLTTLANEFTDPADGIIKYKCRVAATGVREFAKQAPTVAPAVPSGDFTFCRDGTSAIPTFSESFFGDSAKPRVAIGFGVNWNSPFGPFRIDIAKVLLKTEGDQTKTFTFNVGTQF
jgi:outer membrane protein insertion porin family